MKFFGNYTSMGILFHALRFIVKNVAFFPLYGAWLAINGLIGRKNSIEVSFFPEYLLSLQVYILWHLPRDA